MMHYKRLHGLLTSIDDFCIVSVSSYGKGSVGNEGLKLVIGIIWCGAPPWTIPLAVMLVLFIGCWFVCIGIVNSLISAESSSKYMDMKYFITIEGEFHLGYINILNLIMFY